jgi:hypothetical protein
MGAKIDFKSKSFLVFKEKKTKFAAGNNKEIKSCQKEHFNPPIKSVKINTVLWSVCPQKMDKK